MFLPLRVTPSLIHRSIDDAAIPFIHPYNQIRYLDPEHNIEIKATALVFVKVYDSDFNTPPTHIYRGSHWHLSKPFSTNNKFHYFVWWKAFPLLTHLNLIKKIISKEAIDYLYRVIYVQRLPIVAVRVLLFNWETGETINKTVLRDKWFTNKGFYNRRIDRFTLRSMDIYENDITPDTNETKDFKYESDWGYKKYKLNPQEVIELLAKYKIDLKYLTTFAFEHANFQIKKGMINIDEYNYLNKKLTEYVLNPTFYTTIINEIKLKLETDRKWRDKFIMSGHPEEIVKDVIQINLNDYIDSLIVS